MGFSSVADFILLHFPCLFCPHDSFLFTFSSNNCLIFVLWNIVQVKSILSGMHSVKNTFFFTTQAWRLKFRVWERGSSDGLFFHHLILASYFPGSFFYLVSAWCGSHGCSLLASIASVMAGSSVGHFYGLPRYFHWGTLVFCIPGAVDSLFAWSSSIPLQLLPSSPSCIPCGTSPS